jgi:hypothetical protein
LPDIPNLEPGRHSARFLLDLMPSPPITYEHIRYLQDNR